MKKVLIGILLLANLSIFGVEEAENSGNEQNYSTSIDGNYYAIDGPEGIETFWIVVGNVFGFQTAYSIYSGFRVHVFWIVAIFAAFIYLSRKNGIIKYNIGRNKEFLKECWKKRLKYALIPAIHYVCMIIIIAIVANILGNNMNYNFDYTIREDNILHMFKDNKLILFIVEQSFSILTSYILAILAILFLEAFGKFMGSIIFHSFINYRNNRIYF